APPAHSAGSRHARASATTRARRESTTACRSSAPRGRRFDLLPTPDQSSPGSHSSVQMLLSLMGRTHTPGTFQRVSLRIAWISHTPVKGLAIRQLDECDLTEAGITGDREFFLVDENDRLVNSKGLGVLQQIVPRHDREAGSLTLEFPDGTTVSEEVGFDGSLGARFWGKLVEVRVVDGPWSEALSDFAGRDLRLVGGSGPAPDRRRSGAATLLGTGSLHALARVLGEAEVDERRFRMNFGIDGLGEHEEDAWL